MQTFEQLQGGFIMKKKLNTLRLACGLLTALESLFYIILVFTQIHSFYIFALKVTTATIALIASSILCGAEFMIDKNLSDKISAISGIIYWFLIVIVSVLYY